MIKKIIYSIYIGFRIMFKFDLIERILNDKNARKI